MLNERQKQLNDIFENITDSLDIPENYFNLATDRYRAIGTWLGRDGSIIAKYKPEIYPQGSFRLGTMIKPINEDDHYDIDLVCNLQLSKNQLSQKQLKELVGKEIKEYSKAQKMTSEPEDRRRCWKINYSDGAQFHMDVLPAVPNEESFVKIMEAGGFSCEWSQSAIAITDKKHPRYLVICDDWLSSNPKGFCEWFKARMKIQYDLRKITLAESLRVNVERVPEYKIKTPLQKAIQMLKRHRDIMFDKNPETKPCTIIITTLAALAYNNETNVYEALNSIVSKMEDNIENRNNIVWIANPVNPTENYADKWPANPQLRENFYKWMKKAKSDFGEELEKYKIGDLKEKMLAILGNSEMIRKLIEKLETKGQGDIGISYPKVTMRNPSKPWGMDGK